MDTYQKTKARYWVGVLYPENMVPDWEQKIGDILQLPYAYCVHDMDHDSKSEHRKTHVHLIVVFPNTTTYKNALNVLSELSAEGKQAINAVQSINSIRHMYDYLLHDTETCKKQGKELYPASARVCGNNFDIGAYEQLSLADKEDMAHELCDVIVRENFVNFVDFYMYVVSNYDRTYFEIIKTYSGLFERLTKGNWQKTQN